MTTVYYSSNRTGTRTGTYQIWSVNAPRGSQSQVTNDPEHHYSFVQPSPDKNRLLCARLPRSVAAHIGTDAAQTVDLAIFDLATKVTTVLATKATLGYTELGHAEWSPDGSEVVAYAADREGSAIVVLDATKPNTVKRVIDALPVNRGLVIDPAWSYDGHSIVYVKRLGLQPLASGIVRADAATGANQRLVLADATRIIFDPQPSPSGDAIAFLEFNYRGGWSDWNLKLVNADGTGERAVLSDNWLWSRGVWMDDTTLVTHGSRGLGWFGFSLGGAAIWRIDRNGQGLRCLVDSSADEVVPGV